jgi:hypothetical protein
MVEQVPFFLLVTKLEVIFQELIFKLGYKMVMEFEVNETMAKVSLKTVGKLEEIVRFKKLLSLHI